MKVGHYVKHVRTGRMACIEKVGAVTYDCREVVSGKFFSCPQGDVYSVPSPVSAARTKPMTQTIKINEKAWHRTFGEVLVTAIFRNGQYRYVLPSGGIYECSPIRIIPWARRPRPPIRPEDFSEEGQLARQACILIDIQDERDRQDKLYGPQNACSTMDRMFVALGEEFGEACQAHLSNGNTGKATDKGDLRKELIQVAALAVAMCERLDAGVTN